MRIMKAVVCDDFNDGSVEEVPRPEPAAHELLVRVDRVQLSVTECYLYRGEEFAFFEKVRERMHEGDGRLFGHEFCGTVVEAGDRVVDFAEGDRVYAPNAISCGDCVHCRNDYPGFCDEKTHIGFQRPGALAEYVALPPEALGKLPDGVDDAQGAAMQPLAASMVNVHDADISTGDVVAVVGAGVMGNECGQLASHMGASEVFAIDIDPNNVAVADEHGLTGIDSREEDPVERVKAATDGIGADVVFEAVGGDQDHTSEGSDPLAQAFQLSRKGGTIVHVGIVPGEMTYRPRDYKEKCIRYVNARDQVGVLRTGPNADTGRAAVEMVASGRVSIEELVTHELDGLESFEEAIEVTLNKAESGALGPAQMVL
jgi:threonine dehydrogenase-like Zn-dependent dehydrogenase